MIVLCCAQVFRPAWLQRYHFALRAAMGLRRLGLFAALPQRQQGVGDDLDAFGGALAAKLHQPDLPADARAERHDPHVVGRHVALAEREARHDRGAETDGDQALDRLDVVELHHRLRRRRAGRRSHSGDGPPQRRGFVAEDQRQAGQERRRHPLWRRTEIVGQDRHQLVVEQWRDLERRVFDRQRADAEIERVGLEHLQRAGGQAGLEIDLELRVLGLEPLQDRRQRVHQHGRAGADADALEPAIAEPPHRRDGAGVLVEQMAGVLDELLAGLGQIDALADALGQRHAEAALQLLHLMGDGGLGEVELFGRGGDAAALDHFDEGAKLIEVEAAHVRLSLRPP